MYAFAEILRFIQYETKVLIIRYSMNNVHELYNRMLHNYPLPIVTFKRLEAFKCTLIYVVGVN